MMTESSFYGFKKAFLQNFSSGGGPSNGSNGLKKVNFTTDHINIKPISTVNHQTNSLADIVLKFFNISTFYFLY